MYAREEAIAGAELVVEGLEGLVAQAKQVLDEADFDEEPRAFLEMVDELGDCLGTIKSWIALAEPAAKEWQRFLGEHPELG